MRSIRTADWQDFRETEPVKRRREITPEDVVAAYHQGKRDFTAGWSIGKARYSDADKDAAWRRGYIEAMQAKRGVRQ